MTVAHPCMDPSSSAYIAEAAWWNRWPAESVPSICVQWPVSISTDRAVVMLSLLDAHVFVDARLQRSAVGELS